MTKEEDKLKKFLASDDPELVRMGIAMAKGLKVEVTVGDLEHFLKSSDVETVRNGVLLADEAGIGDEAIKILDENLNEFDFEEEGLDMPSISTIAAKILEELGEREILDDFAGMCESKLEEECERLREWNCGNPHRTRSWDGDDHEFSCGRFLKGIIQIYSITNEAEVDSLVEMLFASTDESKGGYRYNAGYWTAQIAATGLGDLGWTPQTDEERIAYSIATDDWRGCIEMGEEAVEKAVKYLAHNIWMWDVERDLDLVKAITLFGEAGIIALLTEGWNPEICEYGGRSVKDIHLLIKSNYSSMDYNLEVFKKFLSNLLSITQEEIEERFGLYKVPEKEIIMEILKELDQMCVTTESDG